MPDAAPPCPTYPRAVLLDPASPRVSGVELGAPRASADDRTPVFLLPAFGLDGCSFAPLAPVLAGRRAFAWNVPNDLPRDADLDLLVARAFEAASSAGVGDGAVWIGSSFGGMLALAAAQARPTALGGLVLLGVAPRWSALALRTRLAARLHPWIRRRGYHHTLARIMFPGDDPRCDPLRAQMRRRTKAYVGAVLHALRAGGGFDLTPRLGDVRAPTLVVHGDRDGVAPLVRARAFDGIPGVRLEVLPGHGHLPYWFDPPSVAGPLRSFLDDADARLRG